MGTGENGTVGPLVLELVAPGSPLANVTARTRGKYSIDTTQWRD